MDAQLLAEAVDRSPIDDREQRSMTEFARIVQDLVDPCSRDAHPRHITASAIVVGPSGVLLHRHKRLGLWLQPGGHIDPGERPWEAARREVREETGIDATHADTQPRIVHVDVHEAGSHTHLDVRYAMSGTGEPTPSAGESQDVRWFSWEDALAVAGPGLVGALKAVRRLRAG